MQKYLAVNAKVYMMTPIDVPWGGTPDLPAGDNLVKNIMLPAAIKVAGDHQITVIDTYTAIPSAMRYGTDGQVTMAGQQKNSRPDRGGVASSGDGRHRRHGQRWCCRHGGRGWRGCGWRRCWWRAGCSAGGVAGSAAGGVGTAGTATAAGGVSTGGAAVRRWWHERDGRWRRVDHDSGDDAHVLVVEFFWLRARHRAAPVGAAALRCSCSALRCSFANAARRNHAASQLPLPSASSLGR